MGNLNNKFAIVTGSSTGIGRAVSVALAKEGARIALVARRVQELKKTKKIIIDAGGNAEIFPVDLSKVDLINQFVSNIKTITNHVDILLNIAGVWHGKDEVYANTNFENFQRQVILNTYNVGLVAPTLLAHDLIPLMPKGGKIINLSGTFENGAKGWLPYYVSKRAIEDLTIGLAEELKEKGIQVNCVSPSDVATEEYQKYFPQYVKNAISPKEISDFILQLCSGNKTGKIFVIKKGQKMFKKFHA